MTETLPPKRRGRPARSEADIIETRARINAAALSLFQSEGFAAVSMRRLAKEAGCTPMTLYSYFDNKVAILHGLWAEVLRGLFTSLAGQLAEVKDPAARLHALSWGYTSYWLDNREDYALVFMSGGISREDVTGFMSGPEVAAHYDVFRAALAEALTGQLPETTQAIRAEALICALHGTAHNLITISGYAWAPGETLVREAVNAALRDAP